VVTTGQHRASPEEQLALMLAGTAERRAAGATRLRELARAADGTELLRFLRRQRIYAVLGLRLREVAPECLSDDEWGVLDDWREVAEADGVRRSMAEEAVERQIRRAGIAVVPLKGTQLAERLYGHAGRRESIDVDVLVPVEDLREAVAAIARLGWDRPSWEPADPDGLPRLHVHVAHEEGFPATEVHWRVDWRDDGAFARAMLDRAAANGGALDPLDELASLLLFFARDGFAGLRLALDLSAWWDAFGSELPQGGLNPIAAAHPRLAPALRAAAATAQDLVGVPAGALLPGHRLHRREALARSLGNWRLIGDSDRIESDITMVDALLTPREEARAYVRRSLLLPPHVIAGYYGLPRTARLRIGLWRLAHPVKVLARYAWTYGQSRLGRA
jgi:hypothetical protein